MREIKTKYKIILYKLNNIFISSLNQERIKNENNKTKKFNKIFKLLKKKIFSTNKFNPKNGDEVGMIVKGIFEEKEKMPKWF